MKLTNLAMRLAISVFALLVVEYVIPGFQFDGFRSALVAAIMIGLVNTFIRPVLQLLALPLTIVTLGIAAFFINVALLWGVAMVVPGFYIDGFVTAAIASIVLTLVNAFLHRLASE
ncbi:MAG: hypothetical protein UV74_C0013G0189 [Candidatus Woesebacteria bacterium GW2011_GWB1_43_14]|uniref:Integral membrane protein n=1 Tax=Candidatus Woesebacteria bacterium GW2011_GWB1_43_14 TaxID=1618578 RepID=A0A0G1DHK0_9BACT|nr:MAG: hypothetical protein UV51_C0005G0032 [Candidatus Woesebacteria bacterium GW2011_GWC1_42_9]KKS97067.1 MAG: hypothetical protein UV74_C0013G0189 [Candidatus Woesebacteria bacterium GW2011_GWB1_43_14]